MDKKMRVMTEKPLNAETPTEHLRSWITSNAVFFDRNQGQFMESPVPLPQWKLSVEGEVKTPLTFGIEEILAMPKTIVSNTMECSGNGRSLLNEKASGNPWTIGGVGNAVWGGIWLKRILEKAGITDKTRHVAFEGMDKPLGSSKIKFIRSIPIEKAMTTTLLAYEMNGDPLPLKHGYPLRAVALGWAGANCVKWLSKITVMDRPYEGFFMDKVYRVFQKGKDPKSGEVVTRLHVKSIITQPLNGETLPVGPVTILGAAYAGEADIQQVDISVDGGKSWHPVEFIGPHEPFAWRQWQYIWEAGRQGEHRIMARATDSDGRVQPMEAAWNVLGYGNNGTKEHAVTVHIK
jgi:DMSO/TMAO reductase YedYZ molybdopterin-dependent catalytic subunit